MARSSAFLIVSAAPVESALYARTLNRRFPDALITEALPSEAGDYCSHARFDAAVIHFNGAPEAVQAIQAMRRLDPQMPILATSGVNRAAKALAAGATRFELAEEFLNFGRIVGEMLDQQPQQVR